MKALRIIAGERARKHIAQHGLSPFDVQAIPGAAGGPKGLILQGLDHFLFGQWFNAAHLEQRAASGTKPLQLLGASIGAWRMAAAASSEPVEALKRLAWQYCEAQRYGKQVNRHQITEVCHSMVQQLVADQAHSMSLPQHKQLFVWVNRGLSPLHHAQQQRERKRGFAAAVLANSINRNHLSRYFERWIFHSPGAATAWLDQPFDAIPTHRAELHPLNIRDALLASGSIPFVLNPVQHIVKAMPDDAHTVQHHEGPFWDGGLTDYHLALPYHRLDGLVLYPHFASTVTPGWLDKFLKLRKARPDWMSNVVLLCPTDEFVNSLPAKKIPDRSDFKRYGLDHDQRIAHWNAAIAESHRLADEFANWLEQPRL
ncbi:patatin-like phospholipase family protein [Limnobacter humi]|uniref:Patatin-like phospholipase family protein n=1 Tax=Limnobacter humi TaxID=1778671 RepID=A0ABT1WIU1_9BURK|nr:patatin-like phospholipase family protein [Limnobacter humi]MCQ8897425.1 patatin-like phospholipase family protein [Limnobacter humi]